MRRRIALVVPAFPKASETFIVSKVLGLLERVNRAGATLAMVTHSNEVAERASRIVRLADGAIVSDEQVGGQLTVGAR